MFTLIKSQNNRARACAHNFTWNFMGEIQDPTARGRKEPVLHQNGFSRQRRFACGGFAVGYSVQTENVTIFGRREMLLARVAILSYQFGLKEITSVKQLNLS